MRLSVTTRTEDGPHGERVLLQTSGEVGLETATVFREHLLEPIAAGRYHLVIDMLGVTFVDSAGLGVLVGALKRVRAHEGSIRLVCTEPEILKLFQVTGLTKVFPIHATVDEAVAATE